MKKLLIPLFALATLLVNTSCSNEEWEEGDAAVNEVEVSFTAQLENKAVSTRGDIGDGTTAKYLTFAVYKAVDGKMGDEVEALRQQVEVNADLTATVNTRLVKGQTYNFVFWAQSESVPYAKDAQNKGMGTYYNIADMSSIKLIYNANNRTANNEARDAFLAVRKELKVQGSITETITLKRPFAQVNVGTKIGSIAEAATAETVIAKSEMLVKNVATVLNTYTGAATEPTEVTYLLNAIPERVTTDTEGDLKNVKSADYEYLSMNYILVSDATLNITDNTYGTNKQLVNCTLNLYDNAAVPNKINSFEIPNVPVQRNWRTNIIGDILSETVSFNIIIEPKFDNDENYITNAELYYAAKNGGAVTMTEDLVIDGTNAAPALVIEAGKSVTLDLNGHNIKAIYDACTAIKVYGNLTINGVGKVSAEGNVATDLVTIWAMDGGQVTINGGEYYAAGPNTAVYAYNNAKVVINGGKFAVGEKYIDTQFWVLNLKDNTDASIEVRGGEFKNFDPANNLSEGAGTSFVAKGYKSVQHGDTYTVVAE